MKVNELKGAMDAQFAEVRAQFAEVGERFAKIDERFDGIDKRFLRIDERFDGIDKRFEAIDQRFENVDGRFRTIDEQFADVRAQFEAMDRRITMEATATRRHFDVVAEDLKSDIRLLAGAVAAISNTLERHINTSLSERSTVSAALDNHEVRLTVLERHRP